MAMSRSRAIRSLACYRTGLASSASVYVSSILRQEEDITLKVMFHRDLLTGVMDSADGSGVTPAYSMALLFKSP